MTGLFKPNPLKRLKRDSRQMLSLANKVINYRRDVLSDSAIDAIRNSALHLRTELSLVDTEPDRASQHEAARKELDKLLRTHGGDIYPVTAWNENLEMVLVAAIVAIGIRTFFFQPFKIPTNSMWPTYAGMKPAVYDVTHDKSRPWLPVRLFRLATQGAINHRERAPVSGEVLVPVEIYPSDIGWVARLFQLPESDQRPMAGQRLLRLGFSPEKQIGFQIQPEGARSGLQVGVWVPADFQLNEVVLKTFFPEAESLFAAAEKARDEGRIMDFHQQGNGAYYAAIRTGFTVDEGEPFLDFDIKTGDMLFVDRFSYHFFPPEVGDPIVFRTDNIPGLRAAPGHPTEQYYIKRLAGEGGDSLKVDGSTLLRKPAEGDAFKPASGAPAFELNALKSGEYAGYQARWRLAEGKTDTVQEGFFYAMGDNSPESYDSRGWSMNNVRGLYEERRSVDEVQAGIPSHQVPQRDVVGKALFIFYPFSNRWGAAE